MGTYHTARGVHPAVRHALEVASAAPIVPGAVANWPKGGQQVIDGFKVGGQHRFFPWRERGWLNPRDLWANRFLKTCAFITFNSIYYTYNQENDTKSFLKRKQEEQNNRIGLLSYDMMCVYL